MNTKTRFSKISNSIFLFITVLVTTFIWLNYYLHNFRLSLLSAVIICAVAIIIYAIFQYYSYNKSKANMTANQTRETLKNYLQYSTHTQNLKTILQLFDLDITKTIDTNHYLTNEQDIYIYFDRESLTPEDINKIIKNRQRDNITVFTFSKIQLNQLPDCISITIIDLSVIFQNFTNNSLQQNINIYNIKKPKFSLKHYLCIILSKERSRHYFHFGLLLIFTSLFTPYHIYYIVSGTILLLLSIYSRFNTKFN